MIKFLREWFRKREDQKYWYPPVMTPALVKSRPQPSAEQVATIMGIMEVALWNISRLDSEYTTSSAARFIAKDALARVAVHKEHPEWIVREAKRTPL